MAPRMRVSVACASRSAATSPSWSTIVPTPGGSAAAREPVRGSARRGRTIARSMREDTVVVLGLGDLGGRVVEAVCRLPLARVVAVARDAERARAVAGQAALVARLAGGAGRVEPAVADLEDVEA